MLTKFILKAFLTMLVLSSCNLAWSKTDAPDNKQTPVREKILLDTPWKFALGHASDRQKDFNHAMSYFSYLAKTGFGDGPASLSFEDRAWRTVSVPHDWAVEMPFDPAGSHSHGYKKLGPGFPESSVGWYRHHFHVDETDLGKKIFIEFEGIQRDARVFVNGFFLGEQNLGNIGQLYDITSYINYGGRNVIAVRADVSIEAGWYYEGAGINRDVHLIKTNAIHVEEYGTFVKSEITKNSAKITIDTTVLNDHEHDAFKPRAGDKIFRKQIILDANNHMVAQTRAIKAEIETGKSITVTDHLKLKAPRLWSIEDPYLYQLVTQISDSNGALIDEYKTTFGVRSIHFDPNEGFFLNGKAIKLKGSNNHEDHAGVGTATPDALIEYRLKRLQSMGMNAYRASHAPASPALLKAADRLGMLVIDETRIAGINQYHLLAVEQMIKRGRNHPSIILWSLGNEEWAIEGNIKGARIAKKMQSFTNNLDPTRLTTFAISGGWGGVSTTIAVMGVNYIKHGDTDKQHKEFPWQVILGTEETTTQQTRGIYFENKALGHLPPQEDGSSGGNAETGWRHYAERDYLAGIFYWTGFDYKGEPTPYGYPAVASQFGILDSCGFAKDGYYYLKAWWTDEPVLHIFPHWNWPNRIGETIEVRAHTNADEVELMLNGKSLGRKPVPVNDHVAWQVPYEPGELSAQAYRAGKMAELTKVKTTGKASELELDAHKPNLVATQRDVAVVTVSVLDANGAAVPTADNLVTFKLNGPGKIIGVGNGNPSSHEADVYIEQVKSLAIGQWNPPPASDSTSQVAFSATFDSPEVPTEAKVTLLLNALGLNQTVLLNGKPLYQNASPQDARIELPLGKDTLKAKGNTLSVTASPFPVWQDRETLLQLVPASFLVESPAKPYQRRLFNGLAQVLVQTTGAKGEIKLSATAKNLKPVELTIKAE